MFLSLADIHARKKDKKKLKMLTARSKISYKK